MTDQDNFDFNKRNETPAEKFKRLGNSRLFKALDAIELLEALSSTATYDYTEEQVDIIIGSLKQAVSNVARSFKNGGPIRKEREDIL